MFETNLVQTVPLTMGFGRNLNLKHSHELAHQAFQLNLQDSHVRPFRERDFHNARKLRRGHFVEVDVKHSKKKEIPGVRHMFCSGYYCAFQYATKSK